MPLKSPIVLDFPNSKLVETIPSLFIPPVTCAIWSSLLFAVPTLVIIVYAVPISLFSTFEPAVSVTGRTLTLDLSSVSAYEVVGMALFLTLITTSFALVITLLPLTFDITVDLSVFVTAF